MSVTILNPRNGRTSGMSLGPVDETTVAFGMPILCDLPTLCQNRRGNLSPGRIARTVTKRCGGLQQAGGKNFWGRAYGRAPDPDQTFAPHNLGYVCHPRFIDICRPPGRLRSVEILRRPRPPLAQQRRSQRVRLHRVFRINE